MNFRIPFNKPFTVGREFDYIAEAVSAGQTSAGGRFTRDCERLLEERFSSTRILLTMSGTAALEMAAQLCDLAPKDEVVLPAFTFVSTANAFLYQGCKLRFVDICPDTLNIDDALIESAVTERTRVIAPVHYAGVCCEMDKINTIAKANDLLVVEDAAQGVDARYNGSYEGTLGDFGCYSFHETKNFICGEGGALVIRDPDKVARAERILRDGSTLTGGQSGVIQQADWQEVGMSCALPELLAAFLYAQLQNMDHITGRRRAIYQRYCEALRPEEVRGNLKLPIIPPGQAINYHMMYVLLENEETRGALINHLKALGILAVFHYQPLHTSPMGQSMGYRQGMLPVTEDVSKRLLRLPMFFDMAASQVDQVTAAIRSFFEGGPHRHVSGNSS